MSRRIIAVMGATGAQGGGLARALLADKASGFSVRAMTRKPCGDKARELASLGAEIVAADEDDVESLRRAFAGAHGVFCVTNFWEHMSPEREKAQAKALAHAARDTGVQHAIWSTLEDSRRRVPLEDPRIPTLVGQYKVPHADAKGESDRYFTDLGVPTTFLLTSFYWENFITFGMVSKKGPDGARTVALPMADKKLAGIAAEDIGKCALGIFKRGKEFVGKTVGIAGEHLTVQQMTAALSQALGQPISYSPVPPEVHRAFGFPGGDDLTNMYQYFCCFEKELCAARDLSFSRSLNPELQTFSQWLSRYKDRIPLPE